MSIQKFPLATIQKVRQYIQKSLALPDSEQNPQITSSSFNDIEEPPEPDSLDALGDLFKFGGMQETQLATAEVKGRWFISTVNPAAALLKLPGLHLKPEYRFACYLYRSQAMGTGVIWAVPEARSTTAELEKALKPNATVDQVPHPAAALPNFMEAIAGDQSPSSLIIASILRREFLEFGALGNRCSWSHHRLVDTVPPQLLKQAGADQLKDLAPRVRVLPDGRSAVEFFTCRVAAPVAIYRHIDLYPANQYTANSLDRPVTGSQR